MRKASERARVRIAAAINDIRSGDGSRAEYLLEWAMTDLWQGEAEEDQWAKLVGL